MDNQYTVEDEPGIKTVLTGSPEGTQFSLCCSAVLLVAKAGITGPRSSLLAADGYGSTYEIVRANAYQKLALRMAHTYLKLP
jgi:hypothetical protein